MLNAIELSLFASRMQSICDEMGATLQHTAFSPNIRDRLDYSCALFDANGYLAAQAAHIPVHLGSMAYAMRDIVRRFSWQPGDCIILNDPYSGGTHLPDVTVISPVYINDTLTAFVANRAHHANIGAETPGSMPIARTLAEEGMIISPDYLYRNGHLVTATWQRLQDACGSNNELEADIDAQYSANLTGIRRLTRWIEDSSTFNDAIAELNDYAERMALAGLKDIPPGTYAFTDFMDDDGQGTVDIPIRVTVTVNNARVDVDFDGTAEQVAGNINCPLSVTAAAVFYCFFCLMPDDTPACAGAFRPIRIKAPAGSMLNASAPAAVAAGNVETSTRIVDCVFGALHQAIPKRIPAASQGSMNNIAMGSAGWSYYETLAGGMGAGQTGGGQHAVQTHMTNTYNTPIEVIEMHYPLRISRYAVRPESGGRGQRRGGDGLLREYEFLQRTEVSLLTERRRHAPWGLNEGKNGLRGENRINNQPVAAKTSLTVNAGDRLTVLTPGGGGWGKPESAS